MAIQMIGDKKWTKTNNRMYELSYIKRKEEDQEKVGKQTWT